MSPEQVTLYYFHDPMCSWCWGISTVYTRLVNKLPGYIRVKRILGGLAADTDEAMPDDMKEYVKGNWGRIEEKIPGVKFNYAFWDKCQPRRSTYPACRAVIAARQQGEQYDLLMTSMIQSAYYQRAKNPSDDATLIELASELGLDVNKFSEDLNSENVSAQLSKEIDFTHNMFVESFPSLVLEVNQSCFPVQLDYNDEMRILASIENILSA